MVQSHVPISVALAGGAAALMAILAWRCWTAYRDTGSRNLAYVTAAFALFAAKSLVTMYALLRDPGGSLEEFALGHGHLEFLNLVFDIAIAALLATPLLRRMKKA